MATPEAPSAPVASAEAIQQSLVALTKTKDGINQIVNWGTTTLKNPQHTAAIAEKTQEYLDNAASTIAQSILTVGSLLSNYLDAQSQALDQLSVRIAVLGSSLAQCETAAARAYQDSQRLARRGFQAQPRPQYVPLSGPRLPPAAAVTGNNANNASNASGQPRFEHQPPDLAALERFTAGSFPFRSPLLSLDDPLGPPAVPLAPPAAYPASYAPLAEIVPASPAAGPLSAVPGTPAPPVMAELKLDSVAGAAPSDPVSLSLANQPPPPEEPQPPLPPEEEFYMPPPPPDDEFIGPPPPDEDDYVGPPPE